MAVAPPAAPAVALPKPPAAAAPLVTSRPPPAAKPPAALQPAPKQAATKPFSSLSMAGITSGSRGAGTGGMAPPPVPAAGAFGALLGKGPLGGGAAAPLSRLGHPTVDVNGLAAQAGKPKATLPAAGMLFQRQQQQVPQPSKQPGVVALQQQQGARQAGTPVPVLPKHLQAATAVPVPKVGGGAGGA